LKHRSDEFLFQRKVLSHTPFENKSFGLYLISPCSYYRIFLQLMDTVISATQITILSMLTRHNAQRVIRTVLMWHNS
jgi:hypothetical protein